MMHLHPSPRAAPSYNPSGASAKLDTVTSLAVEDTHMRESDSFTIAFWIYVIGIHGATAQIISIYPLLSLSVHAKALRVSIGKDTYTQQGQLLFRRWTHIAVSYSNEMTSIFVNGVLDTHTPPSHSYSVGGDLIIGKAGGVDSVECYIDDVRVYDSTLSSAEVAALTLPGVTGIVNPSMIRLGCIKCRRSDVYGICGRDMRICSRDDLMFYGYHIARVNGWTSVSNDIWTYDEIEKDTEPDDILKMALCCEWKET
eukprot:GHVO01013227.1.p1 GENE.GHVO01013227.1~~GHVO01013227.1.p1  ORF type:complete len:255 (-),score=56.26 GHVO01013227.1:120-884(-)